MYRPLTFFRCDGLNGVRQTVKKVRRGSHERRECKRKKINVWTTVTQTQARAPTQEMEKNSFSCTSICVCISHVWTGATQTQMQTQGKTQVPCHHGQPRPPTWKNTSTAPAYVTFLALALDVCTSFAFAFAFALAFAFAYHVWTRLNRQPSKMDIDNFNGQLSIKRLEYFLSRTIIAPNNDVKSRSGYTFPNKLMYWNISFDSPSF